MSLLTPMSFSFTAIPNVTYYRDNEFNIYKDEQLTTPTGVCIGSERTPFNDHSLGYKAYLIGFLTTELEPESV